MPSYNIVCKGCGLEGYVMGDPKRDPDCDVPNCYCLQSKTWGQSTSRTVQHSDLIDQLKSIPHRSQGISFIKAS